MSIGHRKSLRLRTLADAGALMACLEPGDVILFKASRPDVHPIVRYQRLFMPPYTHEACAHTHAAMFIGADRIAALGSKSTKQILADLLAFR